MKFTEHLSAHITPEWRKQYINYEEMKSMLYAAVEQSPSAELIEPEILSRYFAKFDETFFSYCDKELAKINTFYSEKLAEATRKYAALKSEMTEARHIVGASKTQRQNSLSLKTQNLLVRNRSPLVVPPTRKLQELKLAFSEFYLSLILLQNYQNLNFTGFRKILKKHDKLLRLDNGAKWRVDRVESSHFHTNKDIDRLIRETEDSVTEHLEDGDRQKAMKRLRVPPLGEQQIPWTTFKVGLFSGSLIVLLVAVFISAFYQRLSDDWRIVVRLYRGPFILIEFLFLWGVNIYGWRSSGVNHVLIFELDPRNHLSEQHLIEIAAVFGVIWSISVLGFLYSAQLTIPPYASPFALVILMLAFLLNPTKTLHHDARWWALKVLGKILGAPFFYVNFADFLVADQLNSAITMFTDLHYFTCFYITNGGWSFGKDANYCVENHTVMRAFMACLPAWFRFAQCLRRFRDTREHFPHLANAAKYATTFSVIIFTALTVLFPYDSLTDNPFFYFWIVSSVVSSCAAYAWDIKMDWGLFDPKAGDNRFLREEVVYSSTWYYYFAIVEDLILRFAWAFSISLTETGYVHADLMLTILAPIEVLRRFIWNFFRLENEHLNNCGKFRAVRDISVAPLDTSDQVLIVRMMDEPDGVLTHRRKKRTAHQNVKYSDVDEDEYRTILVESESAEDLD